MITIQWYYLVLILIATAFYGWFMITYIRSTFEDLSRTHGENWLKDLNFFEQILILFVGFLYFALHIFVFEYIFSWIIKKTMVTYIGYLWDDYFRLRSKENFQKWMGETGEESFFEFIETWKKAEKLNTLSSRIEIWRAQKHLDAYNKYYKKRQG